MGKYWFWVLAFLLITVHAAFGEDVEFWSYAENEVVVWEIPETACIVTEFCGDAAEDSDVRCVRVTICGEPIR